MPPTLRRLPAYLRRYCVEQPADKYTERDHAVWRYIMRQSRAFFRDHAVPVYTRGLQATGITVDRIPSIAVMDEKLQEIGWGAVPVCGFIPPAAFLDFQARRVLPIAFDMRPIEQISYTPAPDIVHEAAGHAPILADPEYSTYLETFADMARKAIFSQEDLEVYEAIRRLSDTKANPAATPEMIKAAEEHLTRAGAAVQHVSEAAKVARLNWWTVEYGLLGSLGDPKIYGAGLLSSVGESQNCLGAKVKKVRLTTACADTPYDITEPQPQLFVAEDIAHLTAVTRELEASLAFRRGGTYGLTEARRCRTVTTTTLDSGLEIAGVLADFESSSAAAATFLRWSGGVQLAYHGCELPGQGTTYHASGFSSPLGRATALRDRPLCRASADDLRRLGILVGQAARLELTSGYVIEGTVTAVTRATPDAASALLSIAWQNCTVRRGDERVFEPAWGTFDQAIGEQVIGVAGGPADRDAFGDQDLGLASTTPSRSAPYSARELQLFGMYREAATWRRTLASGSMSNTAAFLAFLDRVDRDYQDDWLLKLEAVELAHLADGSGQKPEVRARAERTESALRAITARSGGATAWLVGQGLALATHGDDR